MSWQAFNIPTDAVGSIIAAMIAMFAGFLGLIISKELKVSEFREAWINDLRNDIACTLAEALALNTVAFGVRLAQSSGQLVQPLINVQEHLITIEQSTTRIRLRLNSLETKKFLSLIKELEDEVFGVGYALLSKSTEMVVQEANRILKKEWKKVKRGERFFYGLKVCLFLLVILGVIILSIHSFTPINHYNLSQPETMCLPTETP